jgi:hypothetical protein
MENVVVRRSCRNWDTTAVGKQGTHTYTRVCGREGGTGGGTGAPRVQAQHTTSFGTPFQHRTLSVVVHNSTPQTATRQPARCSQSHRPSHPATCLHDQGSAARTTAHPRQSPPRSGSRSPAIHIAPHTHSHVPRSSLWADAVKPHHSLHDVAHRGPTRTYIAQARNESVDEALHHEHKHTATATRPHDHGASGVNHIHT